MTAIFLITGPKRHYPYVLDNLADLGIETNRMLVICSKVDGGNNQRQVVNKDCEAVNIIHSSDPRRIAKERRYKKFYVGEERTPMFGVFNIFYQNDLANHLDKSLLIQLKENTVVRLRTDCVVYRSAIEKISLQELGYAVNPVAHDSFYFSDQFSVLPFDDHSFIYSSENFNQLYNENQGVPESMIRHRSKGLSNNYPMAFRRYSDFDIVYENLRFSDSPFVFWTKIVFGWECVYQNASRLKRIDQFFAQLHGKCMQYNGLTAKLFNLVIKVLYLPFFTRILINENVSK